jgi:hypothetical protein
MSLAVRLYCFLIFICHHAVVLVQANGSYSHTIPYGQEECLLIRVPKDQPHLISGSFDCLDTKISTDPIRVALYNSEEKKIWSSNYGDHEGSFHEKGTGKHWLCLENGLTWEQKEDREKQTHPRQRVTRSVGFSLRVKKSTSGMAAQVLGEENANGDADGHTQKLLELADDLNENFEVLADHMSFMKARESVHRELHEQTFTKVVRWNILEICTVVVLSFGQVLNVWWILSKRRNNYY